MDSNRLKVYPDVNSLGGPQPNLITRANGIPLAQKSPKDLEEAKKSTATEIEIPAHKIATQIIIDILSIIGIFVIFGLVYILVEPKLAYFTCDNSDIFYPYMADTVPFWAVGVYGVLGPLFFIGLVELANANPFRARGKPSVGVRKCFLIIYQFASLLILGIGLTLVITEIGINI